MILNCSTETFYNAIITNRNGINKSILIHDAKDIEKHRNIYNDCCKWTLIKQEGNKSTIIEDINRTTLFI